MPSILNDNKFLSEPSANARARDECIKLLGGKCADPNCRWLNEDGSLGCGDFSYLQLDHIDEDGVYDRRRAAVRYILYLDEIQKGSRRFQVLCANCHYKKSRKNARKNNFKGLYLRGYGRSEL